MSIKEDSKPLEEVDLYVIGREFGEQDRVPSWMKCLRYVQRDGPDFMSKIGGGGLHALLTE